MTTQFVERIAVETDGAGDDVLLIPGLGGTSNVWVPLMPTLMRHRTVRWRIRVGISGIQTFDVPPSP